MKFIGQHIWCWITRFKSKVYAEDKIYLNSVDTATNFKPKPLLINTSTGEVFVALPQTIPGKGNTAAELGDNNDAITGANLGGGIMTIEPTSDRTKPTDTAANIIGTADMGLDATNDCFETVIVNTNASNKLTITAGSGVTLVGGFEITAATSATVRITRTGASAVSIYRTT